MLPMKGIPATIWVKRLREEPAIFVSSVMAGWPLAFFFYTMDLIMWISYNVDLITWIQKGGQPVKFSMAKILESLHRHCFQPPQDSVSWGTKFLNATEDDGILNHLT